jgi:hypothetical protein
MFAQKGAADRGIKTICNIKMPEDAVSSYVAARGFDDLRLDYSTQAAPNQQLIP